MMRGRVPRSRVTHERWLVSYADFITLLFGFFVVLYAFSQASRHKQAQISDAVSSGFNSLGVFASKVKAPDAARTQLPVAVAARIASADHVKSDLNRMSRDLQRQLAAEIGAHHVSVQMNRDGLVVSLQEAGFFASGSARPRPEAEATLRKIAASIEGNPYYLRVEGHTDNVPIHTTEFDSNWELSSARATCMARKLIDYDAAPPERVSAAGYAEFRPVAGNDTPEGRAKNRRVDLVLMPGSTVDLSAPEAAAHPVSAWRKITDSDPR